MDHNDSLIIDRLGGNSELAEMFDISSQAVSKWRKEGIPRQRLMYLKLARPDVFEHQESAVTSTVNPENTPKTESELAPLVAPALVLPTNPRPEAIHECASGDPRYHPDRRAPDNRHARRRKEAD